MGPSGVYRIGCNAPQGCRAVSTHMLRFLDQKSVPYKALYNSEPREYIVLISLLGVYGLAVRV